MNTNQQQQQSLPLVDGPETREERCQRLLARLGQPQEKLTTAAEFDYDRATRIAEADKARATK